MKHLSLARDFWVRMGDDWSTGLEAHPNTGQEQLGSLICVYNTHHR
jgi:hypothetical protein